MSAAPQPPTETALQKERRLYREIFDHLINAFLNWFFDLRPERARRRMSNLMLMLLIAIAIVVLIYYPPGVWGAALQGVFGYLFNPNYAASHPQALAAFIDLVSKVFIDPSILQYIPILIAPFFIAQQLAAYYLADIFELEDVSVARRFVSEVALSGSDETIRISQGQVSEKHLESPNYLIGGPGKVVVDLDSVALFERADGTPHVIGPTGKDPGGKATIDGFERFRQSIDIRDHHVELRGQDRKSPPVKGRSRDGIPITATDVRLMFSIYRGENPQPTSEFPYPFDKEAIERIVYKSVSRVTPDQVYPSAYEFSWINNMIGLIRGRLGGFMSGKNLTEYLANTGQPEFEKSKQREELIAEQMRRLTQPDEAAKDDKSKSPPPFTPRHKVTDLFSQFANEFTQSARNNGVELHWIGVGTWKTPPEIDIVSENHLEAWKLSRENMKNGSAGAFKKAESKATLEKMETLIRNVPIDAYYEIVGTKRSSGKKQSSKKHDNKRWAEFEELEDFGFTEEEMNEAVEWGPKVLVRLFNERLGAVAEHLNQDYDEGDTDLRDNMRSLLLEYRKQLLEAVQFMKAKDQEASPIIDEAIKYINIQMGFKHWAGSSE